MALVVEGLTKSFDSTVAIDELSFCVDQGEVVGLLGPNGAGKTTTVSCIAGLLRPDRGAIQICGLDATQQPRQAHRYLGVASQRMAIYPTLDVETNLRFYAELAGAPATNVRRLVAETVELLHLQPLLSQRVRKLSVGQQRLVHVASALVSQPRVLLLDEPTAGLDVGARALVLDVVRKLAAKGAAVLYSSHYLAEVEDLCSRVAILHRGKMIAHGQVDELVTRYGGGRVELVLEDQVVTRHGDDLRAALASVPSIDRLRSARVVRASLEAVFLSLTGESINQGGDVGR